MISLLYIVDDVNVNIFAWSVLSLSLIVGNSQQSTGTKVTVFKVSSNPWVWSGKFWEALCKMAAIDEPG